MINHKQLFKRFAARTAFSLVVVILMCSASTAQQLTPNPNLPGNTITITGQAQNIDFFDNYGTIDNQGLIDNWGTIDNSGTFDNLNTFYNYMFVDNYGAIYNSDLINNWGGTIYNHQEGCIDNRMWGTIDNLGGNIYNDGGTIYNQIFATIYSSGSTINPIVINNWGHIYNWGTIDNNTWSTIQNSGTIENSGTIDSQYGTFLNQGTLTGTGTFRGNLLNDSGTVAPGSSPGTMTIEGNFTLAGSGILDIEIGGFTAGTFDLLGITGTAYLSGGTIDFSFLSGYDIASEISPGKSMMLQFLYAGNINSLSSGINFDFLGTPPGFQYDVFQQNNGLYFQAFNSNDPAVIPTPNAILLGSIGIAIVGWLRRSRTL